MKSFALYPYGQNGVPCRGPRWRLHLAILGGFLSFLLALALTESATASERVCRKLFVNAKAETLVTTNAATTPPDFDSSQVERALSQWSVLNEDSREFIRRLVYLIKDRRLLPIEAYQKISDARGPINPLGERPANITLQPHHRAFASLIEQNQLQWDVIGQSVRILAGLSGAEKSREQDAIKSTERVLYPLLVKKFDFQSEKLITTNAGKTLAIGVRVDKPKKHSEVSAYEIPSGTEVAKVSVDHVLVPEALDAISFGDHVLIAVPEERSRLLVTVDLDEKTGKMGLLAQQMVGQSSFYGREFMSALMSGAFDPVIGTTFFTENKNSPEIVTFIENKAFFVDPWLKRLSKEVTFNKENSKAREMRSGMIGNMTFVTDSDWKSTLMISAESEPLYRGEDFKFITGFSFKGKSYALGRDMKTAPSADNFHVLRVLDIETGQPGPVFEIDEKSDTLPNLFHTFEQNGTLYGLIISAGDTYVVDLINGKIVNKKSTAPWPDNVSISLKPYTQENSSIGFDYHGRHYIVAQGREGRDGPQGIYVVDALDLTIVAKPVEIGGWIDRIQVLPSQNDERWVLVKIKFWGSRLISLTNTLQ